MAIYQSFATTTQLAAYLGVAVNQLPTNAVTLLQRASEIVAQVTMGRINTLNADHMEAAQLATCAQVEYWISLDESVSKMGGIKSISIGSFSIDFGDFDTTARQFAPRARNYLNQQGLLYRGVYSNANTGVPFDSDLHN